jgi:hypothetical protein
MRHKDRAIDGMSIWEDAGESHGALYKGCSIHPPGPMIEDRKLPAWNIRGETLTISPSAVI